MSSMKPSKTLRSLIQQAAVGLAFAGLSVSVMAQSIVMSSTTSTEQSGLFGHLLPEFKKATGIDVKVVALGTGQALDMARRGDADVVFVHDQVAEEKFVAEGFGVKRLPVMYNDFVLVGPANDPANTRGKDIVSALQKVANTQARSSLTALTRQFLSRHLSSCVQAWPMNMTLSILPTSQASEAATDATN